MRSIVQPSVLVLALAGLFGIQPACSQQEGPSPILIIPGVTGSQLDVTNSGPDPCNTFGTSEGLWINFARLSCFQRELGLMFEAQDNLYTSPEGVTVGVPGFGETRTVQWLNTSDTVGIPYMNNLVQYFLRRGYVEGVSIRAAPYDWRLAADNLERNGYYQRLMQLVQDMYEENGNRKVTIVVHSMGGPVSLYFLTQFAPVTQQWKDTYINAWVTLSGAWSGGNVDLQAIISGVSPLGNRSINGVDSSTFFLRIVRSMQSSVWLLPRESIWGNRTLVTTPSRTYSAQDYEQLFADIGYDTGYQMLNGIFSINPNFPAPNVPTYCYYGVGRPTVESVEYTEIFDPNITLGIPSNTFGDGDGTVNVQSSEICLKWRTMESPFNTMTFDNVSHMGMLENIAVLSAISDIVGAGALPSAGVSTSLVVMLAIAAARITSV